MVIQLVQVKLELEFCFLSLNLYQVYCFQIMVDVGGFFILYRKSDILKFFLKLNLFIGRGYYFESYLLRI